MPSKSADVNGKRVGGQQPSLKKELSFVALSDSLRGQIRLLIANRQVMYDRVRAHHRDGQVVPTSVCDELNENTLYLRAALDRYTDTTRSDQPAAGRSAGETGPVRAPRAPRRPGTR